MRIALLTHQWPGVRMGGIGSAVRQTAAALAAAGHDVHVFTLGVPADLRPLTPPGVHLHETADLATRVGDGTLPPQLPAALSAGGEGAYRLAVAWILCAALLDAHRQNPFDVVEAPEVEALGLPLLLNSEFDAPVVTHLHCCTAIAYQGNQAMLGPAENLITALEFAAIRVADRICAPTRAVVRATEQFLPMPGPVGIIPHPFSCAAAPFTPPPADGPMLFIGRIERLKGAAVIAQALNAFLPAYPAARFRFIGPDTDTAPGRTSMRQHVRSLLAPGVANRVEFTGELSHAQIADELRACSFVVQPSLWENFSMTCCEAFAAGRTVIVGAGTGSVELIAEAGLAVDPRSPEALAQAMHRLWSDRPLLADLSHQAWNRVRADLSPAVIAAQRTAFYQDAIADFRQRRRTGLSEKLATLPPASLAAVLPAFCTLTGALAGVHHPRHTAGARLLRIMDDLRQQTGQPARVLLYGAGKHTARLLAERELWESQGHRIAGLIDDHPRFADSPTHLGLPVRSLAAAMQNGAAGQTLPPVVLSTDTYQDQFWAQTQPLRARGTAVFRLYDD